MLMDIHTFFPTLGPAVLAHRVCSSPLDPDCLAPFKTPLLSVAAVVAFPFVLLHCLSFHFYLFMVMDATMSREASIPLVARVGGGSSLVLYFRSLKEEAKNPPQMQTNKKQTKIVCLSRPSY